jgi:hypothetical protein
MAQAPSCFVIMPFRPDLHYFYLFVRRYLKEKHGIDCERADHRILTIPFLEKIKKAIMDADVLLVDISGRNPNVFYELGLADALGKKVILITQDAAAEVPSDIRHLEFIKYDLDRDTEFLDKLDNAIHHVFAERYGTLYEQARKLLAKFNTDTRSNCGEASEEEFQARVTLAEGKGEEVPADAADRLNAFLLPKIIKDVSDIKVLTLVGEWLAKIPTKRRNVAKSPERVHLLKEASKRNRPTR